MYGPEKIQINFNGETGKLNIDSNRINNNNYKICLRDKETGEIFKEFFGKSICISDDGMYMVHKYHPLDQQMHMLDWNSGKYPLKYLSESAKKVFEDWVDFND